MDINNESHNNETPKFTEGEPVQPTQPITYMQQTTPPAKKKWYKSKLFLIVILMLLLLGGGSSAYVLVIKKDDSNSTTQTNTQINETLTETEEEENIVVEDEGIPGLKFTVPEEWTIRKATLTHNKETNESYVLYSSDAESGLMDDFSGVTAGYSIGVNSQDRDLKAEKEKDKPIDAYTTSIGSPRIEEEGVDFSQQKIDESQYKNFKNDNGVEMVAFPWAYEGCFLSVTALGKRQVYSFSISQGKGCPNADLLTSNDDIESFFNSVKLDGEDSKIEAEVFAYVSYIDDDAATGEDYQVKSRNISFSFKSYRDDGYLIVGLDPIPKMKDSMFDKLQFGPTKETTVAYYEDCDSCNYTQFVYDNGVAYLEEKPDLSEYKEISQGIFGIVKDIEPLKKDGEAKQYTYIRALGDGYVILKLINESMVKSYPFPAVDADFAVKTMKSFKTL